jgi:IclR family transcriptional regulator, pca regulon regulatory protein
VRPSIGQAARTKLARPFQITEALMKRSETVSSLVRGLEVLKAFGKHHDSMTITEVALEVGLTPASARRMLLTLAEHGYITQTGKRFRVGAKVLDLGYSYIASMPIWQIAQPVLDDLSNSFHVSAAAAVLDGCDALYTIRANARQTSTILVSTGTRLPAHLTAMGRVLLAYLTEDRLDDVVRKIEFNRMTQKSVASELELRQVLQQVRQQAFSIVDEEMIFGLRAIAVPLRNKRGDVVASINACGNHRSLDITFLKKTVLPALSEGAERIRTLLPA